MNRIIGQIDKERLFLRLRDITDHFISQAIRQILSFGTVFQLWITIRRKISFGGMPRIISSDINIKPILLRIVFGRLGQMPLARHKGRIPVLPEGLGHRYFVFRQMEIERQRSQPLILMRTVRPVSGNIVGQVDPGRVFTGQKSSPGRRRNRTCGIGLSKTNSFSCQLVDMRSFIETASGTTQIRISQIVCINEDHIGMRLFVGLCIRGNSANATCDW